MKKGNKKLIIILFILISIPSFLFYTYHYVQNSNDKTRTINSGNIQPGRKSFSSFKGLSFKESIDDKTSFKITAEKAFIRNRKIGFLRVGLQKVAEMEKVTLILYENTLEVITVKSDQAILNLGSKNIIFEGHVVCSTNDGRTLKTKSLSWDKDRKLFRTDEEYIYNSGNGAVITGKGFESDQKLAKVNSNNKLNLLSKRGKQQ